ncbi:polar amino acid transport system substrate-binding protein [Amycolatopsis xylanica]|uniref:Polar amino acid transport system substrate-binding protein n=1 Tax=Amycolatopsis xylanica TaxID=589385 RepID=A0A1H3T373_9PSEU|nr:glutamate ABC transporter substrate-binding protein [Amycolatopsis xylanica]SDZ44726.1 polar amino acid transport system substrate-binding protein [Amycolatopsis xylanica]
MKRLFGILGVALLASACGTAGTPVDPAPVTEAIRPQPAHVGGADVKPDAAKAECGDPLASLAPQGKSITGTMAKIKERGHLIAGVDQTTFLFGFRNPTSGALEGFDIDMAKQVAKAIFGDENKIRFRAIPSKLREDVLKEKQVDIVVRTYSINCSRLKDVAFSSVYYKAGQKILVDKSSRVKSLPDLANKKVCATKTSTSLTKIATDPAKPVPVSVDNWSDCLVMLQQGQVDAVSTDDVILAGMAAQDPTVQVVGEPFTTENYGIGIPKENEDMVRFVNAVLEDVRGNGVWKQSYTRWLGGRLPDADPPQPTYK